MPQEIAGGWQADAEEGQGRLGRDEDAQVDGGDDDHRGQRVGQHVRADDPPRGWPRARGRPGRSRWA